MEIRDSRIVVTGAASGIGRALARRFAREGARLVVVVDLDGEAARALAAEIGGVGLRADVGRHEDVTVVVDEIEAEHGPIDLFCSNAGILIMGGEEVPDDDWQRIWDVNVMSHIHAARALVPRMLARGGGYLLNTASAAGLLSQIGSAPYSVTKHAAVGFAEWLSITYGERGLKVSVLCPQAVRTAMLGGSEDGGSAGVDGILEPDQVADCVVDGLRAERFLLLPHGEVAEYVVRKASDPERWLRGMRRLQSRVMPPG